MIRISVFICLFLLSFVQDGFAQSKFPKDYFGPPLAIPLLLSGSFSELRNNHFHGGVDFRTLGQDGVPILAVADGHISRIRVSGSGYGYMLFLEHSIGYTSAYSHLSRFADVLEAYVKEKQYELEQFDVTLEPDEGQFTFRKGDTIAFSGNTGHSKGPHLHFEIRESKSNWLVNPLYCGFDIKDNIKPRILAMKLYPLTENSAIQVEYHGSGGTYSRTYFGPVEFKTYLVNGVYVPGGGVKQFFVTGSIGIAAEFRDQMNGSANILDIYRVDLALNDEVIYRQQRSAFSMEDARYINAHREYESKVLHSRQFQRLFVLMNNNIDFYEKLVNKGVINLKENDSVQVNITASDFYNNSSRLSFPMSYFYMHDSLFPEVKQHDYQKYFFAKRPNHFSDENIELFFQENSFYEDVKFEYKKKAGNSRTYSDIHSIHKKTVPVHHNYTIRIKADKVPEKYRSKALIAEVWGNSSSYVGGVYKEGYIETKARFFGDYAIVLDTVAPTIKTLNFWNNSNIAYLPEIRVSISDNLSGIKSYRATINDEWILMEYDQKRNLLFHRFDGSLPRGEHSFKLIVTDNKDNINEINLKFKR